MELERLCAELKERVALELREAADPAARVEVLIGALYEASRSLLPALGTPKPSIEYQKRQAAVAELVSFVAITLVREGVGGERGVAVLSEVAEGCRDPLLKRKLSVYARELLISKRGTSRRSAILQGARPLLMIASCVVAAFVIYIVWPGARGEGKRSPATAAVAAAQASSPVPSPVARNPAEGGAANERTAALTPQHETRAPAVVTLAAQGEQVTRVRVVNSQVLVPVTLRHGAGSLRLELLLDTGSTRTALHEGVAGKLPIDLRQAKSALAELADGRMVRSRLARIDLLTVGPFAHPALEVELISYSGKDALHDGLLGMDVLGKHRYQIDVEHELIRWF